MLTATNALLFVSLIFVFSCNVGYSQPKPDDKSNVSSDPSKAGNCPGSNCVVQQICHGGPSSQAFSELVHLVKEMNKKLEVMEAKLDAVCNGDCPTKRSKYRAIENIATL